MQDPLSESEPNLSPYNYVANNSVNFFDLYGLYKAKDPYPEENYGGPGPSNPEWPWPIYDDIEPPFGFGRNYTGRGVTDYVIVDFYTFYSLDGGKTWNLGRYSYTKAIPITIIRSYNYNNYILPGSYRNTSEDEDHSNEPDNLTGFPDIRDQVLDPVQSLAGKVWYSLEPKIWTSPYGTTYVVDNNGQIIGIAPMAGLGAAGWIGPGNTKLLLQLEKQLAKNGPKSIIKTYESILKRLAEHKQKLPNLKYKSSVEREIRSWEKDLETIKQFIKDHGIQ